MRHLPEASQGRGRGEQRGGKGGRARRVVVPRDLRQPVGEQDRVDLALVNKGLLVCAFWPDILFLRHACSILRQSSNLVCGFFMMEQVRLCAV